MTEKNKISIPDATRLVSDFHLSMDRAGRGISLILSGASAIRDFSDQCALFRVRGFLVRVKGAQMSITVYENKTVELTGRIEGVEIVYDKT